MSESQNAAENLDEKPGNDHRGTNHPTDGRVIVNVEHAVIDSLDTQTVPTKKKHDWYDNTQLVLLGFTFAAAFAAAIFTGWIAWRTNHIANDSTKTYDATNRAYIAITGVKWDGRPEVGKNQRIKILFKNVGKEAASDFSLIAFVSDAFDFAPDGKEMPYVDPTLIRWPYIPSCTDPSAEQIIGQRPVYPDVSNEAIAYAFNPGPSRPNATFVPQRIIDGKATFWVAGCAIYRSLGKARHSPFCFYYQPG
jgi:hypothetical protein